jgi:hypothetical protein
MLVCCYGIQELILHFILAKGLERYLPKSSIVRPPLAIMVVCMRIPLMLGMRGHGRSVG